MTRQNTKIYYGDNKKMHQRSPVYNIYISACNLVLYCTAGANLFCLFQDWRYFKDNHLQTDQKVCSAIRSFFRLRFRTNVVFISVAISFKGLV